MGQGLSEHYSLFHSKKNGTPLLLLSSLLSPLSLTAEPRDHQPAAQLRRKPASHNTTGLPSLLPVTQLFFPFKQPRQQQLEVLHLLHVPPATVVSLGSSLQPVRSRATTTTTLTYLFPLFASFNFVSHLLFYLILVVFN